MLRKIFYQLVLPMLYLREYSRGKLLLILSVNEFQGNAIQAWELRIINLLILRRFEYKIQVYLNYVGTKD